jgi:SAM-dependent methyltransferase
MKLFLLPHLICPACLPHELPLSISVDRENDGDVINGNLSCKKCKRRFPIRDGVALLVSDPDGTSWGGQLRYEETGMIDRYLWSHYGDLLDLTDFGDANVRWAELLGSHEGLGFDAGCAVGRLTFEIAAKTGFAVGCDLSHGFIKTARKLAREKSLGFSLPFEGNLSEDFRIAVPDCWHTDNVEFIVADALRIPFAKGTFCQIASMNLLDRVSYPLAHLYDMNRIARDRAAAFLFADPFSWSTASAPEEAWLGGKSSGPYKGRGIDNVHAILEGKGNVLAPPWQIADAGSVAWKMRSHSNHYEVIHSQYLNALR